jgi:hypothetical protein
MNAVKIVFAAILGFASGIALSVLLCIATGVVALATSADAALPGLFMARAAQENGALALEFVPNFVGFVVLGAVMALVNVLFTVFSSRNRAHVGQP